MAETSSGGFKHHFSDDSLRKWMNMPAKAKLEWLDEINKFLARAVPEENREIIEKFRKGEI
jgi:hypothetical protein